MMEQEARNLLYGQWQNGEIPNNFDENHSQYEKAVQYILENVEFDYKRFSEDQSVIRFGAWQIESDALVGSIGYDYIIDGSRLWEHYDYKSL